MIEMIRPSTPTTDEIITEFEDQHNLKLPEDYRDFILEVNGGRPVKSWQFDFVEVGDTDSTSSIINYFLSFSNEYNGVQPSYRDRVENEEIPPDMVPIAIDPGGNLILISAAGEDFGTVCFCDHELEDSDTGYMIISPIEKSFTKFLQSLYSNTSEE